MLNGFAVGVSFVLGVFVATVFLLFWTASLIKQRAPSDAETRKLNERLIISVAARMICLSR